MQSNKNNLIGKEINLSNEINSNNQQNIPSQSDDNNQQYDLLIINNEEKNPNINYRYYQKEIYINKKQKIEQYSKKPIYKKVRSDSYKNQFKKAHISNYIYRTNPPISTNNVTTDFIKYNSNSKYAIKNPVKEKSKNKLKKNYSQNLNILYKNKNKKNLRIINSIVNNTDINENNNEEDIKIINNTNSNFRPMNDFNLNINNPEYTESTYQMDTNIIKGGNINLNPTKKQYIPFNEKINSINYNKSPRDEGISYIYDYSQENNKDSYYIESPNNFKHLSIYPLKPKLKKSSKRSNDNLKKQIEDSKLKFEKIREIEKKIKNYFNINGLNIKNRELYDQSATMIQSAFRAYFSRMKLYKELNLFVNTGLMYETLKKIITPRKVDYWQEFLKGILNYLSFINNLNTNNQENSDKKKAKKIPNSYRKKTNGKKLKNNVLLIPQLCVSFELIKKNEFINKDNNNINKEEEKKILEEKLNKILLENEELKKINENMRIKYELNKENIIKDTQKSVELNLDDQINFPSTFNNNDLILKKSKLKYIIKNKISKEKDIIHKYFLKFFYNSLLLKNSGKTPMIYSKIKIKNSMNSSNEEYSFREKTNEKLDEKKMKKLKNIVKNIEQKINNNAHNVFIKFYFKGLINQIKNENIKEINSIIKDDNIEEKKNDKIELINNENEKDN